MRFEDDGRRKQRHNVGVTYDAFFEKREISERQNLKNEKMETPLDPSSSGNIITYQECFTHLVQCQAKSDYFSEYLKIILFESVEIEIEKFQILRPNLFGKLNLRFNLIAEAWQIFLKVLQILIEFLGDPVEELITGNQIPDRLRYIRRLFPSSKEFVEFREFQTTLMSQNTEKILFSLKQILQDTYFLIINPKVTYPAEYCQKYKNGKCRWGDRCVYLHE